VFVCRYFRLIMEALLVTVTLALAAPQVWGQASTTSKTVTLEDSGTLTFTVHATGLISCGKPNQFVPSYQSWTSSGFVFTDLGGVEHDLSGTATYLSTAGSGPGCPTSGASPAVLQMSGPGFIIQFVPAPGGGTPTVSDILLPQYYILSVLYAPPGNQSSNGYTNSTSNAATTAISQTFVDATSTTITASSPLGTSSVGVTFTGSQGTGESQSFQISTSDGTGSQVSSNRNPVDHTQDQIFLWLNPEVIVTPTGTTTAQYAMTTPNGTAGLPEPMDIVNVNVQDLMNPAQIPLAVLLPQTQNGVSLPGLASICANPVPPAQCTAAPCGCVASDFATILAADPLVGSGSTTQPSQVDSTRYVLINSTTLEGPECSGCDPVKNSFTETDAESTTETSTETNSYSVGYSSSAGLDILGAGLKIQTGNTFTWTNSMSSGETNGTSHTATITLGTSSLDCFETISIYEDTVYHTFAFAPSATPPTACQ
jgi:hypothetical protein